MEAESLASKSLEVHRAPKGRAECVRMHMPVVGKGREVGGAQPW